MIRVFIGTNTQRTQVIVSPTKTLKEVLDEHEINYSIANIHLDGSSLKPGDLNKTFEDFQIKENCYLIAVIKADNAF